MLSIITSFFKHPLGKKNFINSFFKFLLFQIFFRIMKGQFLYRWIDDCVFLISPGETGLTGNFYLGLDEFEEMGFLLHYLNEDDLFIDVGANVGSYTLLSGVVKKCNVISFEPIPNTFEKLKLNVNLNSSTKKIKLFNIGISDKKGQLYFSNNLNTTNKVVNIYNSNNIKIKVNTLDSFELNPTVIKIDVEGYEKFVLKGAKKTLKSKNLKIIIIELNESGQNYGNNDNEIYNLICSFGFISYHYDPFKRTFKLIKTKSKKSINTIFIRGDLSYFENRVKKSKKYNLNGISF